MNPNKEKNNENARKHYNKHKEELRKKSLEYYYNHKEIMNAKHKKYCVDNREKNNIQKNKWYKANRLKVLAQIKIRQQKIKTQLVEYKGGKCVRCGYNKCLTALDFHHINPDEKKIKVSVSRLPLEQLKKEVDKCILLCANCHREEHYKIEGEKDGKREKQVFILR